MLLSMLSVCDIPWAPAFRLPDIAAMAYFVTVAALKATAITLLLSPLLSRRRYRHAAIAAVVLYALLCLVNGGCWLLYGFGISRRLIIILSQTTPREISEFIPGMLMSIRGWLADPATWMAATLAAALIYCARYIPARSFRRACLLLAAGGIISMAIFASCFSAGRSAPFLLIRLAKYTCEVRRSEKAYRELIAGLKPLPHPETVTSSHTASTIILVIGESASSGHYSLYGYTLPTTPNLDRMRDSLAVFTDAIGSSASTAGNLERILTFKHDDTTFNDWHKFPAVIDMFRTAGYKCFWLSNQERIGAWGNSSIALTAHADVITHTSGESSEDVMLFRHDEALLPHLDAALADSVPHKLIIIQLAGSHADYKNRYPAGAAVFNAADILSFRREPWITPEKARTIAEYDNSIRYTDSIIACMINHTKNLQEPAVFAYLSDHGENVYDDRDFVGRDIRHVRVPLLFYLNTPYLRRNPSAMAALRQNTGRPVSTANIVHTLMSLSGTAYCEYDSVYDLTSRSYFDRPRYVDEAIWKYEHKHLTSQAPDGNH